MYSALHFERTPLKLFQPSFFRQVQFTPSSRYYTDFCRAMSAHQDGILQVKSEMSAKWGKKWVHTQRETSVYSASYVCCKLYRKLIVSQAINYGVLKSRFVGATGDIITPSWSAVIFTSDNSCVKASELSLSHSPIDLLLEICRRRPFPSSLP